jgi:glycerol kinase
MKKYILAFDQGTTSSRCIIFDMKNGGAPISSCSKEFKQLFPNDGWVEHDPSDILNSQITAAKEAISRAGISADEIAAIGITNQRETTIVWDKDSGAPIYNAIVWQCRRTAELCDKLKLDGSDQIIQKKTGLIPDSYFSATKIKWILDNVPGARESANTGRLMFGTVDSWLIYNLTGKKIHATDYSNASRTMLYNINTLSWDDELLQMFDIPKNMMAKVLPSCQIFGYTDKEIFGAEIPIAGVAGDQQAALFGQCCFESGSAKNTYGTGGFMLMNTGDKPVYSKNGLLTTIAWGIDGKVTYALEGSVFVCGAAIQWLRDGLRLFNYAYQSEELASAVSDSGGVYFVPAFVGLGAPYWDPYARGLIIGITRGTTQNHIVRAVLESMAYQTYDVIKVMEEECGEKMTSLKVDGGAAANNLLMSFQSDILNLPIIRPSLVETTAYGVANMAAYTIGIYSSLDEIKSADKIDKCFYPNMNDNERKEKLRMWRRAIKKSEGWSDNRESWAE